MTSRDCPEIELPMQAERGLLLPSVEQSCVLATELTAMQWVMEQERLVTKCIVSPIFDIDIPLQRDITAVPKSWNDKAVQRSLGSRRRPDCAQGQQLLQNLGHQDLLQAHQCAGCDAAVQDAVIEGHAHRQNSAVVKKAVVQRGGQ